MDRQVVSILAAQPMIDAPARFLPGSGHVALMPLARVPTVQESVDQEREIVAVAAFENGGAGNRGLRHSFTARAIILDVEGEGAKRVAHVAIEPGGDEDELRLELQRTGPRIAERGGLMAAGRFDDEGEVEDVSARVAAGAWIRGVLMHGDVAKLDVSVANLLGAIAVMGIEIPNGNSLVSASSAAMAIEFK